MLGKASEIEIVEMWYSSLDSWKKENPDCTVIDIKYALGIDNQAAVLIIYKEGESS